MVSRSFVSGKRDTFGARPGSGRGSGAERFPACGKQVGNLSDRHGREALEDVGEIFLGVDGATAATEDEGVDDRTAPTGVRVANEQPTATTHGRASDRIFHQIIIDLKISGLEISDQRVVFVEQVTDGLAQRTLWQERGL